MNKKVYLVIFIALVISLLLMQIVEPETTNTPNTCYISDKSVLAFLSASPTLIGILLASVLTSLAIILAIIGNEEMTRMKELEKRRKREIYQRISTQLRHNVHFILISFVIATFLSIFFMCSSIVTFSFNYTVSFELYKLWFIIIFILFILSCYATYDIINGLFYIFQFKYDLANSGSDK